MSVLMAKLLGMTYLDEATGDEGVSSGGAVGTGNDARLALLNQINDQNDALAAEGGDLYDVKDDGTTEAFVVQKADGTKEELKDEAVHEEIVDHDADKVDQVATPEVAQTKHKIKVNGVEQELTYDELVAKAQKVVAADQYLAEAARIRNTVGTQDLPPKKDETVQVQSDEEALALARAIQMGSEEEAVAAIRKITSMATEKKGPSNDDLARTIDERLTFNEAIAKFNNTYNDLVSDPHLHKMVLDKDAELIAKGDRRPYFDRYQEIGNEVRAWVGRFKPATTASDQTKPVVDKAARKAETPSAPKAAGAKVANSVEEEKEESMSEVIAGIAKSRGGPQWMSGMK